MDTENKSKTPVDLAVLAHNNFTKYHELLKAAWAKMDKLHEDHDYTGLIGLARKVAKKTTFDPCSVAVVALHLHGLIGELDENPNPQARKFQADAAWVIAHCCVTCADQYRREMRAMAIKLGQPEAILAEAGKRLHKGASKRSVRHYLRHFYQSPDRNGALVAELFAPECLDGLLDKARRDWDRASYARILRGKEG